VVPFSRAPWAFSPEIVQDHFFSTPHSSAKFRPNLYSFPRDIRKNVFYDHYNIGVKPVVFSPTSVRLIEKERTLTRSYYVISVWVSRKFHVYLNVIFYNKTPKDISTSPCRQQYYTLSYTTIQSAWFDKSKPPRLVTSTIFNIEWFSKSFHRHTQQESMAVWVYRHLGDKTFGRQTFRRQIFRWPFGGDRLNV